VVRSRYRRADPESFNAVYNINSRLEGNHLNRDSVASAVVNLRGCASRLVSLHPNREAPPTGLNQTVVKTSTT
jgi:hypothetical protein